jgi:putative transposase
MPTYRRAHVPGGTFFLTLVTYKRAPLFTESSNVTRLRRVLSVVKQQHPFEIVAAVVLPDHLHFVWALPAADPDFSTRVGRLKALFTQSLRGQQGAPQHASSSRLTHRESDVWQRRFWEHTIRDEHDFRQHLDYIHYNPVKHGLAKCPHLWTYSSFERWVKHGAYTADWCCVCDSRQTRAPNFTDIEKMVGE